MEKNAGIAGAICFFFMFIASFSASQTLAESNFAPAGFISEIVRSKPLDIFKDGIDWQTEGPEGKNGLSSEMVKDGPVSLRYDLVMDHYNENAYPVGWPSITHRFQKPEDWSGYNAVRFWLYVVDHNPVAEKGRRYPIKLHMSNRGQNAGGLSMPNPTAGSWQMFTIILTEKNVPMPLDKVGHIQWFISEGNYKHGEKITFFIDGLTLLEYRIEPEKPQEKEAFMELKFGKPSWATVLEHNESLISGKVQITTGNKCSLASSKDQLLFTFHDIFGSFDKSHPFGWKVLKKGGLAIPVRTHIAKLPVDCPAGNTTELEIKIPLADLELCPGYYYATMDIMRNGKSITAGRVGCDDFYLKSADETMNQTALGYRLGTALYARDMLFGGVISTTALSLPGTYDPLAKETYPHFIQKYAVKTEKVAEHFEMGICGCVFAAAALRETGNISRAKYLEWLMKDSMDYTIANLLLDDGSALTSDNDLARKFGGLLSGKGSPAGKVGIRSTDQIAELLKTISRVILHLQGVKGEEETVERYLTAGRRMADFLVRHTTTSEEGLDGVFQDSVVSGFGQNIKIKRTACLVYVPRHTAGLAYFAYTWTLAGRQVPVEWDRTLHNSTMRALTILKQNDGHYDLACGDKVEGGCHRPLGNIYAAEAFIGEYLYARQTGNKEEMQRSAEGAKIALEFLMDKGGPGSTPYWGRGIGWNSQWVRPYLYWLCTEYKATIGKNEKIEKYMETVRHDFEVTRAWIDIFSRVYVTSPLISPDGGGTRLSLLGYVGPRILEEEGKPFKYPKP